MYFYFSDLKRADEAAGKPVHPYVQNAISFYETHPLFELMKRLDEHNLAVTDKKHFIKYSINDKDIINLKGRDTVERTDNGHYRVMRWEEHIMTVSEDEFIPKVLEHYAKKA